MFIFQTYNKPRYYLQFINKKWSIMAESGKVNNPPLLHDKAGLFDNKAGLFSNKAGLSRNKAGLSRNKGLESYCCEGTESLTTSTMTGAMPCRRMPSCLAAHHERSMMRPRPKGPRSVTRTTTTLSLAGLVTRNRVPKGWVR